MWHGLGQTPRDNGLVCGEPEASDNSEGDEKRGTYWARGRTQR